MFKAIVCFVAMASLPVISEPLKNSEFIKYSDAEKSWWYAGSYTSLAHLASTQYGQEQSDCVWRWYFDHREQRQAQLLESFKNYPDYSPTTVVIALLRRDCHVFTKE